MRKLLAMLSLTVVASCTYAPAFAQHHHYHGGSHVGWVGPAIVGGIVGYAIAPRPAPAQPIIVQPPVVVQQPPVYVNPPVVVQPQANVYQPQQYCESPAVVDQFGNHRQITYCYYK
jgi:hypothetical protein